MECTSEFRELASHNPFIHDLDDLGYDLDFINGYFVIFGVPYLAQDGTLGHGDLACPIDVANSIIDPSKSHQKMYTLKGRLM